MDYNYYHCYYFFPSTTSDLSKTLPQDLYLNVTCLQSMLLHKHKLTVNNYQNYKR